MATRKRCTLLRHAKSSWTDPALGDHERPLNERGERDVPRMARRLRSLGVRPSLIITSTAARALQTVRLFAREIGYPLEFLQREAGLYLAPPEAIVAVIGQQDESFNDLLVCGHNPGMSELAATLTRGAVREMPTCGAVILEAPIRKWAELPGAEWQLVGFETPKAVAD